MGPLLHWAMPGFEGDSGRMRRSHTRPVPIVSSSTFEGFRFPPEVIVLAVRWYLRFGLSYRDLEVGADHHTGALHRRGVRGLTATPARDTYGRGFVLSLQTYE